jgi:hypothetical protein
MSRVVVAGDHEVAPLERLLGVELTCVGTRRLARRLERLAGAQQGLRGDARPVRALATDQLALDQRDTLARVQQRVERDLSGRAGPEDDRVEPFAHAVERTFEELKPLEAERRSATHRPSPKVFGVVDKIDVPNS